MFNLGLWEIFLLAAIALIVVGPEKLPKLARDVARFLNDIKKTTQTITDDVNKALDEEEFQNALNKNDKSKKKNDQALDQEHHPAVENTENTESDELSQHSEDGDHLDYDPDDDDEHDDLDDYDEFGQPVNTKMEEEIAESSPSNSKEENTGSQSQTESKKNGDV